jgi:subtilisin family serine protease
MRKLLLLALLCASILSLQAQTKVTHKLGLSLYNQLKDPKYANSNTLRPLLVKGEPSEIQSLVAQYHGVYKFSAGDVSSIAIPYRYLTAFAQQPGVIRIESSPGARGIGRSFMDSARVFNNIDSVQAGFAPLTQAYKGTGVIVGVIDGGFYFRHMDFRRANGNTRILYLWDQYMGGGTAPQPYNYGSYWDSTAINAGLCTHSEPASDFSHGTNVAGIAAGNGTSVNSDPYLINRYTGVAPDADLILVRLNDTASDYFAAVTDAVNYIFTKASQMGRPCVINTSIGTYYGSHDGQDLGAQAIDAMLEAQHGRVLVAAAGNAGGLKYHLSYTLSPTDSLFTWFAYYHRGNVVYYDLWADTAQWTQAGFAIGCDNMTPAFLARTRYFNAVTDFNPTQGNTVQLSDSLMQGSTKLGDYTIAVTLSGGTYHVEFLVYPTSPAYMWRLQTLGQGRFDAWVDSAATGGSSPVRIPPGGFTSPNYRYADSLKTIVSSWQCSDKVITVANYSNRSSYLDVDSVVVNQSASLPDGILVPNSSIGPTRDGRFKPDIGATGTVTTCTGDSANIALLEHSGATNRHKVSIGGKHNANGGTSMASPIVAGVAALYLQKHPNASYSEVKYVIETTARLDTYTTHSIPNVNFGWGKVNGFAALKYNVIYGCQDTGSVNYNALANIDTGGCIPKVYGCTDTGSINYNPSANVNNGTCIAKVYGITDTLCSNYNPHANVNSGVCIPLGVADMKDQVSFEVIPNPVNDNATIRIISTAPLQNASVKFYDVLGKEVDAINIPAGASEVVYKNTRLAAGIYDAAILSNGKVVAVKKIVAE